MQLKFIKIIILLLVTSVYFSCTAPKQVVINQPVLKEMVTKIPSDSALTDAFLENLLQQYPNYFSGVLTNRKNWKVQIIYTQINRSANGIPSLKNYYFNVNAAHFFYPAAAITLPEMMLALQKLRELNIAGLDKNTAMITEAAYSRQTAVYNDPMAYNGVPTIAQYIKKLLLVNDADAANRLFEFLSAHYINETLKSKSYRDAKFMHRLGVELSDEENRHTNPVNFLSSINQLLYAQKMHFNTTNYDLPKDSIGTAYYKNGKLIQQPMDFSDKNRIGLESLHSILTGLIFPSKVRSDQRFNLTEEDRKFLLQYMSEFPSESNYPPYKDDTIKYSPALYNYLLWGGNTNRISKNIRIFNQSGMGYGQLTDVAYIVDFETKVEFLCSATIYCNEDGVLNDDKYDYDKIGLPFMQHLGEVLYQFELNRTKKILPDLKDVQFMYN